MIALKMAKEIDALSKADDWLRRSSSKGSHRGVWRDPQEAAAHEEALLLSRSGSLPERFPQGALPADLLASALVGEIERLHQGVAAMRRAMDRCQWPDSFEAEGRQILRSIDAFASQ